MSDVAKWLGGITVLAIVATVFTNRQSPAIISAGTNGIAKIYSSAMGK